jgi:hypothetical protein
MMKYGLSASEAEEDYQTMVSYVQSAQLTVNFNAFHLFHPGHSMSYQNVFERNPDPDTIAHRNPMENALFKYGSPTPLNIPDEVRTRIMDLGTYAVGNNTQFMPCIRPKYGTLNIFKHGNGGASDYGSSYLVLKDYMKWRCTFTAGDSFFAMGPGELSTFLNMGAMLRRMDDNAFDILYLRSKEQTDNLPPLLITNYFLEAQIHAEVLLSRDVVEIGIDNFEFRRGLPEENVQFAKTINDFRANHPFIKFKFFD